VELYIYNLVEFDTEIFIFFGGKSTVGAIVNLTASTNRFVGAVWKPPLQTSHL
jgi:hypothetical protein